MVLLYNIGIRLYSFILLLASLFVPKARLFVDGRKNWKHKLKSAADTDKTTIWFHCSSLGEFEQGRPLMEALKIKYPDSFLCVSFFSPSGYEIRKNYELADYVCYLPLDTKKNARQFIDTLQPNYVFFVKYEFWFNFIAELSEKSIPLFNLSGIFRKEQHFFSFYGKWFAKQLRNFSWFYLQNQESLSLLNGIGIKNCSLSGDTRFDRAMAVLEENKEFPIIERFSKDHLTVFGGSCWDTEEAYLGALLKENKELRLVLAPHNVAEGNIQKIIKNLPEPALRYSEMNATSDIKARVLIIDSIGILASAYRYADISLIGGGYNDGLHNVLEAVSWGSPVLFGPKHQNFPESYELMENGAGIHVESEQQFLNAIMRWIHNRELLRQVQEQARTYAAKKSGVCAKILTHLDRNFNL